MEGEKRCKEGVLEDEKEVFADLRGSSGSETDKLGNGDVHMLAVVCESFRSSKVRTHVKMILVWPHRPNQG